MVKINNSITNQANESCQEDNITKYVEVALKLPNNNGVFSYKLTKNINNSEGLRVIVPFRNKFVSGIIIKELSYDFKASFNIKEITEVIDEEPIITKSQKELIEFCSAYYFNPLGLTYQLATIKNQITNKKTKLKKELITQKKYVLNNEQTQAATNILNNLKQAFLLQGVTGSGKTLVYLHVAQKIIDEGGSVLFLVPEIALSKELVSRVQSYLGIEVAVIHSNITSAKKRDEYLALLRKEKRVLIGARSAIFAPMPNLGLIIVDEEHDQSFKQDESPRYNARDLALWRAKNENATIILSSATPSLETIYNINNNKIKHLLLPTRHNKNNALPTIEIIDLKDQQKNISMTLGQKMCILSKPLISKMREALEKSEQVLLFLNQRGYAKFGLCNTCGFMVSCISCSVALTYYEKRQILLCHQCQYSQQITKTCNNCQQNTIVFLGLGTERVEEEVKALFPKYTIARLDRDIIQSDKKLKEILALMHDKTINILIGTQMVAKGHDFLNLSLVGVICADTGLAMADFRASEKTFNTLIQVSGRCGRGETSGDVIIQTFNPTNEVFKFLKTHDVNSFIRQELKNRETHNFPPFSKACIIRVEHENQDLAQNIINYIKPLLVNYLKEITIFGPATCIIEKISNRFRYQCLIMTKTASTMQKVLQKIANNSELNNLINKHKARFIIDRDPYTL
jgi:primosomal protein N' (replication factor Y)